MTALFFYSFFADFSAGSLQAAGLSRQSWRLRRISSLRASQTSGARVQVSALNFFGPGSGAPGTSGAVSFGGSDVSKDLVSGFYGARAANGRQNNTRIGIRGCFMAAPEPGSVSRTIRPYDRSDDCGFYEYQFYDEQLTSIGTLPGGGPSA